MGGIGMIGTRAVYDAVMRCDLLLMVAPIIRIPNLSKRCNVVQLDQRPQVLGRRTPTALGVVGAVRPSLQLLLKRIAAKTDTGFFDHVAAERRKWDERLDRQADPARSKDRIYPQAVARMVGDIAGDAVFVSTPALIHCSRVTGSAITERSSLNNAAVGNARWAKQTALRALDRSRQVIVLTGDGGFNMLMCEFMTAVRHKLPVKVVVYNNSALGLITLEAEQVGLPAFYQAIEFPSPDFMALAKACGGHGFRAEKPDQLQAAIKQALAVDSLAIVDAVVGADELPNLPHIELDTIGRFAIAKEAILAATGS